MQTMTETLQKLIGKPLVESTDQEIYLALLDLVRSKSAAQVRPVNGRKLYYISAEFLIGKLLSNTLITLGVYDDVRDSLAPAAEGLSTTSSTCACMVTGVMPLRPQARTFPTLRKLSRSRALATAVWAVWLPASWILWQR